LAARVINWLCRMLGVVHNGIGWFLNKALGLTGRTLGRVPWSCRCAVMAAFMALLLIYLWSHGYDWLLARAELNAAQAQTLTAKGWELAFAHLGGWAGWLGLFALAVTFLAFVRRRWALVLQQVLAAAFVVLWTALFFVLIRAPAILHLADPVVFDRYQRNYQWIQVFQAWVPVLALGVLYLLALLTRSPRLWYGGTSPAQPLPGDLVVENLKTHGGDPLYRTSSYWSLFAHVFALFGIPLLIRGCMEKPYGIIKGTGEQVIQVVKVKPVKKKKKDELILNMDSPILFYRPELDDSRVLEELMEETEATYVAQTLEGAGLGKGGKGRGGWPKGMEGARVRFIRLEYDGGDWDQDMGVGADYNMLIQMAKITNFPIAERTESIPIRQLRRFPKHRGPPFVFITGRGSIAVSAPDVKILRWYCLQEGGMIFADNGGGHFDSSFRNLMRRAFPELEWVDIASDDILYRQPFLFPSGAPPLWHHSGNRALGLKHNGRWIVFYHQGDVNDAWKDGHSGAGPELASQAYKLGINIINYAFNRYYELHYE